MRSRYEFFADDLPIWGFVGPPPEQTKGDSNVYIYTHKSLDIAYNGNRVSLGGSASIYSPTLVGNDLYRVELHVMGRGQTAVWRVLAASISRQNQK